MICLDKTHHELVNSQFFKDPLRPDTLEVDAPFA